MNVFSKFIVWIITFLIFSSAYDLLVLALSFESYLIISSWGGDTLNHGA